MSRHRILMIVAALAVLALAVPALAQMKCSNRMTRGTYGFTCTGMVIPQGATTPIPIAQIGVVYGDGNGHWEGYDTASIAGTFLPQYVTSTGGVAAVVNPDCSGTITYKVWSADPNTSNSAVPEGVLPINFVVVNNGNEIDGLPTNPGYIVTCRLIRSHQAD